MDSERARSLLVAERDDVQGLLKGARAAGKGSSRGSALSWNATARCSSPVRTRSGRSSVPSSTVTVSSG